jgi:hypothetical protein
MISSTALSAFSDELQKLAYGNKEHAGLAGVSMRGSGGASKEVKAVVAKGTHQVDAGIRHPWLPHTDNMHSFPGSQSRARVGKNVVETQDKAVKDIAHSIALHHQSQTQGKVRGTLNKLRSSAAGYRGLKQHGEASHQLADISAHYDKPHELGVATGLRQHIPQSGYGGGIASGLEHRRAGMKGISSKLDELKPSASKIDSQAVRRQQRLGSSTTKKIQQTLVEHHGFSPEQAASAHHEFMHSPGFSRAGRYLGEATRDAGYVTHEAGRAARAGLGAVRGVAARAASHLHR